MKMDKELMMVVYGVSIGMNFIAKLKEPVPYIINLIFVVIICIDIFYKFKYRRS